MTFEELFQPGVAPIVGAIITAFFGINTLFLRWLTDSFKSLKNEIKDLNNFFHREFDLHETKDQTRHEENLYRFEKISIGLARLGLNNGTYDKDKNVNAIHN